MLTIKCAACKRKLWKYEKIGQGQVLRCHKSRMGQTYEFKTEKGKIICQCGKPIGIDKGKHIQMIRNAFVYTGTKQK